MRELRASDKNKIIIKDNITGDTHIFYYRTPLLKDKLELRKILFNTKDDKISEYVRVRIDKTLEILTGFEKGTFAYDGKIISSDPADSDYRADWKELIKEIASDILEAIALKIWDAQAEVISEDFFSMK